MTPASAPLTWTEQDDLAVNGIRILAADMVERAASGHPGMPMGFALPAHILWTRHLRFNPDNPFWPARDRFLLSAGHGSALQYILLHFAGYDLPMEELKRFRQWASRTPGHPEVGHTPGVETTTGPLGQGIANAVGMAMAQRYVAARLPEAEGFDPLDHRVYVVVSDGDLQEGISSEVSSLAGHHRLGRLIALYDDNEISIDGSTSLSWSEDVAARYEAYGWHVEELNGDDPEAVHAALEQAKAELDRPSLLKIRTQIGRGSPAKAGTAGSHGAPLGEDEVAATREALGWEREPFDIPDEIYQLYTEAADQGRQAQSSWLEQLEAWIQGSDEASRAWSELVHGEGELASDLPSFDPEAKVATRAAFGKVINHIAAGSGRIVGGSADLAGSNKTTLVDEEPFLPDTPLGRNIFFGVREHAMGGIANGMALYGGLRPYTGTFLVFSDYMRPAIRLAAIMGLPVVFVFSHDSIGVGEDGPTHQPVEHYAALRAIPDLVVFRPGDAAETAVAIRAALARRDGPSAILTSRQKLPVVDRTHFAAADGVEQGGYILADCAGVPELILIATGSELQLALAAWERLNRVGVRVRLVSLPSWELFEEQDEAYREKVLPAAVKARVTVEAGVTQGWERYAGEKGISIGISGFGASAPGGEVFEQLGFTEDRVIETAKLALERVL